MSFSSLFFLSVNMVTKLRVLRKPMNIYVTYLLNFGNFLQIVY